MKIYFDSQSVDTLHVLQLMQGNNPGSLCDCSDHHTLFLHFRFGKRVSRAFSFNKTPGKLKRAVSSVAHTFSPFVKDSRYTPRGDLRGKRLASSIDLTVSANMHFRKCIWLQ